MAAPSKTTRRRFLAGMLLVPGAVTLWPGEVRAAHHKALLCGDCGFGSKKDSCAKCGKWMASTRVPARLCSDCGFGSKSDNCVRCGKWVGSSAVKANVCGDCGFGSKKDNCVKCGKWAP
ncbi:MAG TPA: hypothetical protein VGK67_15985 [Myxococcales bacterium]|jgi:ribosomal protein L37E